MIERIELFAPSLLIISLFALISCWLYLRSATGRFSFVWGNLILLLVFGPTAEELIFRAPLLIFFNSLSFSAWFGITLSTFAFVLIHVRRKGGLTFKISSLVTSLLVGIITGFSVVDFQSIWAGVMTHFAWNFLGLAYGFAKEVVLKGDLSG